MIHLSGNSFVMAGMGLFFMLAPLGTLPGLAMYLIFEFFEERAKAKA